MGEVQEGNQRGVLRGRGEPPGTAAGAERSHESEGEGEGEVRLGCLASADLRFLAGLPDVNIWGPDAQKIKSSLPHGSQHKKLFLEQGKL